MTDAESQTQQMQLDLRGNRMPSLYIFDKAFLGFKSFTGKLEGDGLDPLQYLSGGFWCILQHADLEQGPAPAEAVEENSSGGEDGFWDQRAPSPPAGYDPFVARQQQQQQQQAAAAAAAAPAPAAGTPVHAARQPAHPAAPSPAAATPAHAGRQPAHAAAPSPAAALTTPEQGPQQPTPNSTSSTSGSSPQHPLQGRGILAAPLISAIYVKLRTRDNTSKGT